MKRHGCLPNLSSPRRITTETLTCEYHIYVKNKLRRSKKRESEKDEKESYIYDNE